MAKRNRERYYLLGCGAIILLLIVTFVGLYLSIFSGPDALEINEYHPFRSAKARERFLTLYAAREQTWPVPFVTRMVETSYGLTYVRISGPENAPALILLHGAGGNSLQWAPNVEDLSEVYRVYAIDNIYDNGRSIYTRAMETPKDFILWLDETFTLLELDDGINLVGLSYGGWLTSQYALYYPKKLAKIVLLAPAATVLPIRSEWIRKAMWVFLPHPYFTRNFMYWLLEDYINQSETNREAAEQWADEAYVAARCFKLKQLVNPQVLSDSYLSRISVPTLFLVGENEKIYSAQEAIARLNSVASQIETIIIPDAGHDLTMAQADLVNGKILEFLQRP